MKLSAFGKHFFKQVKKTSPINQLMIGVCGKRIVGAALQHLPVYIFVKENLLPVWVIGYLNSFTQSNLNYGSRFATEFTATINRNPENTISSIVDVPPTGTWVDSLIYTYHSINGGNSISTVNRSYDNQV